jgi:hypothetical protein
MRTKTVAMTVRMRMFDFQDKPMKVRPDTPQTGLIFPPLAVRGTQTSLPMCKSMGLLIDNQVHKFRAILQQSRRRRLHLRG